MLMASGSALREHYFYAEHEGCGGPIKDLFLGDVSKVLRARKALATLFYMHSGI